MEDEGQACGRCAMAASFMQTHGGQMGGGAYLQSHMGTRLNPPLGLTGGEVGEGSEASNVTSLRPPSPPIPPPNLQVTCSTPSPLTPSSPTASRLAPFPPLTWRSCATSHATRAARSSAPSTAASPNTTGAGRRGSRRPGGTSTWATSPRRRRRPRPTTEPPCSTGASTLSSTSPFPRTTAPCGPPPAFKKWSPFGTYCRPVRSSHLPPPPPNAADMRMGGWRTAGGVEDLLRRFLLCRVGGVRDHGGWEVDTCPPRLQPPR